MNNHGGDIVSKGKEVEVIATYAITEGDKDAILGLLESEMGKKVYLSRTVCGYVRCFRGVPAGRIHCLDCSDALVRGHQIWVAQLAVVHGRHSHRDTWRLTIRSWSQPGLTAGEVSIDEHEDTLEVRVGEHGLKSERLGSEVDLERPDRIVSWHWQRWYKHLTWEEVRPVADEFVSQLRETQLTRNEANRLASRLLYRASRDLGWVKLDARQKVRLGLDADWHRQGGLDAVRCQQSVGEATSRAADPDPLHSLEGVLADG